MNDGYHIHSCFFVFGLQVAAAAYEHDAADGGGAGAPRGEYPPGHLHVLVHEPLFWIQPLPLVLHTLVRLVLL